jgi:hypothetical protein
MRSASTRPVRGRLGRRELAAVGLLFGAVLIATFVTYARVSHGELYHVSRSGVVGGLSRALMEVNFPDAVIAVPLALIAVDVLRTRGAVILASLAIPLCVVTAWPGVVDQANFDAKLVNMVPATGVVLTLLLVARAVPRLSNIPERLHGDRLRLGIAVVLAVGMIPYLFAELGFYGPNPLLADEPTPWDPQIAAVHLGSHEGMDGALIALAVLALSRLTPSFVGHRLAAATSTLLALLLAWGIANLIQDDWLEQVVKRGWTARRVPSVVHPQLSVAWATIAAVGIAIEVLWFRRERHVGTARPVNAGVGFSPLEP